MVIVIQLLSSQFHVSNGQLTAAMVSYYSKTLRGLILSATRAEKTRSFLAASPVKLLSSLWNGSSNNSNTNIATANGNVNSPETVIFESKNQRQASLHRANSFHSMYGSIRGRDAMDAVPPENPIMRLEQTFTGYTAALQCRKGAIIGRSLLNRSLADELSVNDLYNRLIENPFDYEVASDLGTEVVFLAFEKFLHIAWAEQLGPVMTMQLLDTLQERANKRVPGDFADFVNFLFNEMAPQNRRAFTAIIKLLADLLDGCGNDSDRGALTLAFAELLVTNGTAANYINLLDRLVEDCDRIFGEPLHHGFNYGSISGAESIHSMMRSSAKSQTGSLTSNASSLRRKFGLDMLLRQNVKDERPSVWRSLSKHRHPATGDSSSLTKATLHHARSIDDNSLPRRFLQRRPVSRDRPPIVGAFDENQRPASSHRMEFPLDTIGEPMIEVSTPRSPKKKRRSSLSDLKSLMAAATLHDKPLPPLQPLQPLQNTRQTSGKINSSPKAVPASRIPISPSAAQALKTPRQKENVSLSEPFNEGVLGSEIPARQDLSEKLGSPIKFESPSKQDSPTKAARHSKALSLSGIPTLKPVKSGHSGGDSPNRLNASPTRSGAQRLRLQSPQKLRERLQTEKKALGEADASLQSELSKIGEEMARVNSANLAGSPSVDLRRLALSLKSLEEKVPSVIRELQDRQDEIQKDMETTVKATETKLRSIDQLHKEAVAENELLYEKFNGELGRIVKALKGKGKEDKEDLMTRLKAQSEETARMKKENARLKREMASLRAALKGTE